jgi:hypothetical protein
MKRSHWWTICTTFALFWVVLAYMGVGTIFTALLALASLAMIAAPVGKNHQAVGSRRNREVR